MNWCLIDTSPSRAENLPHTNVALHQLRQALIKHVIQTAYARLAYLTCDKERLVFLLRCLRVLVDAGRRAGPRIVSL